MFKNTPVPSTSSSIWDSTRISPATVKSSLAPTPTLLQKENGKRERAESLFQAIRKEFTCPACKTTGSFVLGQAKDRRHFTCGDRTCRKSLSVTTFLEVNNQLDSTTTDIPTLDAFSFKVVSAPADESPISIRKRQQTVPMEEDGSVFLNLDTTPTSDTSLSSLTTTIRLLTAANVALRARVTSLESQLTSVVERLSTLEKPPNSSLHANQKIADMSPKLARTSGPKLVQMKKTMPTSLAEPGQTTSTNLPDSQLITSPPTMSGNARMSYAAILKKQNVEEGDKMEAALASLASLRHGVTPRFTPKPDEVQRLYISGFTRMPIRELKSHLYNLRVRMKKVYNLAFVSRTTVEFLIAVDYVEPLKQKMNELSLRVLENYDPSMPQDAQASEDVRQAIFKAFTTRIENHAKNPAVSPVAQAFYQKWLNIICPERTDRTAQILQELGEPDMPVQHVAPSSLLCESPQTVQDINPLPATLHISQALPVIESPMDLTSDV